MRYQSEGRELGRNLPTGVGAKALKRVIEKQRSRFSAITIFGDYDFRGPLKIALKGPFKRGDVGLYGKI